MKAVQTKPFDFSDKMIRLLIIPAQNPKLFLYLIANIAKNIDSFSFLKNNNCHEYISQKYSKILSDF